MVGQNVSKIDVTAEIHIRAIFDDIEDEVSSIWLENTKKPYFLRYSRVILSKSANDRIAW